MTNTVIKVENLSKQYRLGTVGTGTLSHDFNRMWARFRGQPDPYLKVGEVNDRTVRGKGDFVWALKDINFDVKEGEVLGVIGKNGAGKSTLLKLLSSVTLPTIGSVKMKGRVGSLLEVGTGFHQELTGRENIYLNGAILGMRKWEISQKLDEIIDFSGVEKYLDTPVKRYSSGMVVRLGFAVAAHLEPEILIVDEVLAVGDIEFQKKCIGKMQDVSKKEGRTILFVSHNLQAIKSLCSRSLVLDQGGQFGVYNSPLEGIEAYRSLVAEMSGEKSLEWNRLENKAEYNNEYFSPLGMKLINSYGEVPNGSLKTDGEYFIEISALTERLDPALTIGYCLYNEMEEPLYWSYQTDQLEAQWPKLARGVNVLRSRVPVELLSAGNYRLELIGGLHFKEWLFEPGKNNPYVQFSVDWGGESSKYMKHKRPTLISPILKWQRS